MNYDSMSEDMPQYWKQGRELLQNMDYVIYLLTANTFERIQQSMY